MANNKMLIDASHREETRVAIVKGNRVEEFDFESEHKSQLRGNIYLAKVTRVEPSLQAAFVDYGGNRHGFLAFSEIHPDYYQIPVADRQALLDAEAEDARFAAQEEDDEDDTAAKKRGSDNDDDGEEKTASSADDSEEQPKPARKRRTRRRSKKAQAEEAEQSAADEDADAQASTDDADDQPAKATDQPVEDDQADAALSEEDDDDADTMAAENENDDVVSEPAGEADAEEVTEKPKRRTTRRKKAATAKDESAAETASDDAETAPSSDDEEKAEKPAPKPRRTTRRKKKDEKPADEEQEATAEADSAATADAKADAEAEETEAKPKRRRTTRRKKANAEDEAAETASEQDAQSSDGDEQPAAAEGEDAQKADDEAGAEKPAETKSRSRRSRGRSNRGRNRKSEDGAGSDADGSENGASVEEVGSSDAMEEVPVRRSARRNYKIQEVIKRRQILLVQVVKEERGNKGAALTTYLSLAGRYSVLMPNTARGGGISRKITNLGDRKRLKSIAASLEVPSGMGVILRTAGASRAQEEIQRDFEYLMRLWENVRTLTLESTAPCLVYEEGSLIKRSIRDLYDKETHEVLVAGEQGFKEAKDFMAMLMPEHADRVKEYKDRIPLFARMGVEAQLDAMLQPQVTLKSGGYIIIDQTEALVAIDVNSGRSTRQHSVEETAVQTNLEAADEVARQLRLRDLAGLIVIDFIDMEERRNIRAVEKRLKDALKNDRARIQVGRISHFGLMEMSRQRIRASVLESTTQVCPTCEGLGHVRSASSVVLGVLRSIEEQLNRNSRNNLVVKVSMDSALYMLNHKKDVLNDLEERFGVSISIATDNTLGNQPCVIERGELSNKRPSKEQAIQPDSFAADEAAADDQASQSRSETEEGEGEGRKRRRRRKRKRGGNSNDDATADAAEASENGEAASDDVKEAYTAQDDAAGDAERAVDNADGADGAEAEAEKPKKRSTRRRKPKPSDEETSATDENQEEKPKRRRRKKAETAKDDTVQEADSATEGEDSGAGSASEAANEEAPARPKRRTTRRKKTDDSEQETASAAAEVATQDVVSETATASASADTDAATETSGDGDEKPKKGWWNRKFF